MDKTQEPVTQTEEKTEENVAEEKKEKKQQRLYERTIRNKKREIAMLKEIGAEDGYIKKRTEQLSDYRDEYLKFLDKKGRTRITGNEWIGNVPEKIKPTKQKVNQFGNYEKRLKDSPYMVKNVDDFDELRYNNSEKYNQLKREYRTIGKINKQSKNIKRDTKTYYDFRKENIETTYHFIYDYHERMYNKSGTQNFTFENVIDVAKKKSNLYDSKTKRNVRSYTIRPDSKSKLILISEENTNEMVSIRYGREKKTWKEKK